MNWILVFGRVRNGAHNITILNQENEGGELPLRLLCKIAIIQSSDYLLVVSNASVAGADACTSTAPQSRVK